MGAMASLEQILAAASGTLPTGASDSCRGAGVGSLHGWSVGRHSRRRPPAPKCAR